MTKVSIIVPVYNSGEFLRECLDSLINQSLREIEIICVNDGSTDDSLNILKSYAQKDKRVKIIDKDNEGQSVARNVGIETAKGDYLGFVDSDDFVDLDYFEKLYLSAKEQDCDIACAGFKKYKNGVSKIAKSYQTEDIYVTTNAKVKIDNLPAHNYVWNKIYRRESWLRNGFKFEAGRLCEDVALTIKLLHGLQNLVTVPDTYYSYRMNSNSTCSLRGPKYLADYKWAFAEQDRYCEENNIYIDKSKVVIKKEYYKFCNITLMKIYYYERVVKYKLLGFIPFGMKIIV